VTHNLYPLTTTAKASKSGDTQLISAYNDGQSVTRRLATTFDYEYDANSNMTRIIQDFNGAEVVTEYGTWLLTAERDCSQRDSIVFSRRIGRRGDKHVQNGDIAA
jgi:hypothetical protein